MHVFAWSVRTGLGRSFRPDRRLLGGCDRCGLRTAVRHIFGRSWILLGLPGAWLVARKRGIFVKVAGSWLAAAAILGLGLGTVATLGNEPDHME